MAALLTWTRAAAAAAALISFGQAPEPDVRYRLRATVDDSAGLVTGRGEIVYRHLGPDTLRSLLLSLVSNVIRPARNDSGFTAAGIQRISQVRVNGMPADLLWPEAPESTRVRVPLAEPVLAGDSVVLTFDWEMRAPSVRPLRKPRGRRLDLLAWYPRLLDETSRTSVPIPALATVLLALDLPADQVAAGTGVPLCGNPGWARAAATPRTLVTLQREWYPSPKDPEAAAASCEGAPPGRNRVTWYAEDVGGMALSMSPTFRYEEGDFLDRPVHVLYEAGDERTWGAGLASRRAETALAWVLELTGPYPWPHITVVQGLEQNGEAAAMMLLPGASSQAAILNQLGLMITHELLPGGAPLFAVGAAAFQTAWFFEVLGRRGEYTQLERSILDWDLDGLARADEPLGVAGSTSPCSSTYCRRTELTFYQLRWWAGGDPAMRDLFRTLYQRFVLRATVPGSFQRLARERILPNPDPLYEQLPRGGTLYDDAIAKAWRAPIENGRWRTTVVVERRATGRFPETVWVVARGDTGVARAAALTPSETLSVVTRTAPTRVLLDPLAQSHDWNMLNNQHAFGFRPRWLLLTPNRPTQTYFDIYVTRRVARDRATLGWSPTAWYNDAGGWTFGGRLREDYLGRFEQNEAWASLSTGAGAEPGRTDLNARLRLRNPVWLRATGWSQDLRLAREEGRVSAQLDLERRFIHRVGDSTWRSVGLGLRWLTVTNQAYVDPRFYDDAGTVELGLTGKLARRGETSPIGIEATLAGGYAYPNDGLAIPGAGFGRFTISADIRTPLSRSLTAGARLFAGAVISDRPVPRQRRIYLAGADPYQRFENPFLRSRGSILARDGVFYHSPGGAGVRGLDPRVSGTRVLGASLELERAVLRHPLRSLLGGITLAAFADGALGNGDLDPARNHVVAVGDAGVGARLRHRLGQTAFETRFDFPLWVSRPALAQDRASGDPFGPRWSFSLTPSF